MVVRVEHKAESREIEVNENELLVGRPNRRQPPDIDLGPDKKVSRRHARIWKDERGWWMEDLGSSLGTIVGDAQIKGQGPCSLKPGQRVGIGETVLWLDDDNELPAPETEHRSVAASAT